MRTHTCILLLLLTVGCSPSTITKKEYVRRYQEAVNLHATLIGQVHYQGSKDGYDYFSFEPVGAPSRYARVKEGEVTFIRRFPYTRDPKDWVAAPPDWAQVTNLVNQPGSPAD